MPSKRARPTTHVALTLLWLGACSGSTGSATPQDDTGGGTQGPGGGASGTDVCDVPQDGWAPVPMRRLTAFEYDNVVADLLGETRSIAKENFAADEAVSGFAANVQVTVGPTEAETLANAAKSVAEAAAGRLDSILDCDKGQSEGACAESFVDRFARRAYRRSPTDEERGVLLDLYKEKAQATNHAEGLRLVIEAVLQQGPFLYRPAIGSETSQLGINKLTGEEMASRLSFFLWSSIPDDELLDTAERGGLNTADGIRQQVLRMMEDARFDRTLESFAVQWLGLGPAPDKDESVYRDFTPEVWQSAKASVGKFFAHIVRDTDGSLGSLLTEPTVFADGNLMKTYAVAQNPSGFARVETDPSRRGGIVTQAAVLAALAGTTESSAVKRGVFIRSHVLCQAPPPPPPSGVPEFPPPSPDKTQRQRLEQHRKDASCSSCHAFFDPLGLAFENFDGVGVYREKEHGLAIDASGSLTDSDVDGDFKDAMELMNLLKGSNMVAECLTVQFFRYAVGRLESDADSCVLKRMTHDMTANDSAESFSLRDAFVKLATSDAFRFVGRN